MKLIPEWRKCWRMYSFWGALVATAILEGWTYMPEDIKAMMPDDMRMRVTGLVVVATFVFRLIKQPSIHDGGKDA